MLVAIVSLLIAQGAAAVGAPRPASEATYARLKPSLFTIEVHSGNDGSRSSLGSGYLVSRDGLVVTNYHVVGAYVDEPQRYSLRAKGAAGERPARLVRIDVVNDLALLRLDGVGAEPLRIAPADPSPGAAIVAFGNPEGLGLSLIEGIFNGYAEKGLVDRMLLSMPLNSGMSGGPILDGRGEVIGTNVSVMWQSNSLSFGVPASKLHELLAGPPLELEPKALRAELQRQLGLLETQTTERLLAAFAAVPQDAGVRVGGASARRPPEAFDCWDDKHEYKDEGVTKARFGCNLQFTPALNELGEVASVDLLIEHFASSRNRFGLFGFLAGHGQAHSSVEALDPENGVRSAPHCTAERVLFAGRAWKTTACATAYVKHPGYGDYELSATSLDSADGASFVQLSVQGFKAESFLALGRSFLGSLGPEPSR